jgi:enoyl-CoA hydratase/carnithine racemase
LSTPHAVFEAEPPLAFLTFNRPQARNAMTWEMYEALVEACDRLDGDAGLRVLILKGAGGKAFVAGTDIGQFTDFRTREDGLAYERKMDTIIDRLERTTKPVIAQIEGATTGGGLVIALACDLRVCTPESRFGIPVARTLGNCLSPSNYARLVDLLGPSRTKDLMFTGRLIDAAEASAFGLIARVVEPGAIDAAVRDLAATLVANAPLTIRTTKEMLGRIRDSRRLPQSAGDDLIALCYTSSDFREGVSAFLAKRTPRFDGR